MSLNRFQFIGNLTRDEGASDTSSCRADVIPAPGVQSAVLIPMRRATAGVTPPNHPPLAFALA
uniref:Ssb n=1 Tax=Sym plasmid TaxID=28430 RepID=A0A515HKG5_9ZZZZ|nr:Ssb [Sym plasmid]